MKNSDTKLTSAAFICLLLCTRCFAALTFFPSGISGGLPFIAGAVLSSALQGLIMLPAALLADRTHKNASELILERNRLHGKAAALIFLVYFLYCSFIDLGDISYFTDYFFSVSMPRTVIVLCCALASVYAARTGFAAVGRISQLAVSGAVLMLIIIALGAAEDMDFTRFDLAVEDLGGSIIDSMISETGRCECLVLFAFLAPHAEGSAVSAAKRFLIAKAIMICVIAALTTAVLGGLAWNTKLPVFTLAASSENLITERSDAVFLLIWLFTGLVKLAAGAYCACRCIKLLRPTADETAASLAAGLIPAAAAVPLLANYGWDNVLYNSHSLLPILFTAFILPLTVLISQHERKEVSPA